MSTNFLDTIANAPTKDIMAWAGCSRKYVTDAHAKAFDLAITYGGTASGIADFVYYFCDASDGDSIIDDYYKRALRDNLIVPTLLYMRTARMVECGGMFETLRDLDTVEWYLI